MDICLKKLKKVKNFRAFSLPDPKVLTFFNPQLFEQRAICFSDRDRMFRAVTIEGLTLKTLSYHIYQTVHPSVKRTPRHYLLNLI